MVTNVFDEQVPCRAEASPAVNPGEFYDRHCCIRGEMLSSFAYVLVDGLRRLGLSGSQEARWRVDTIRLRLLKIAARVRVTCRRVVFHLCSHRTQTVCERVLQRLCRTDYWHRASVRHDAPSDRSRLGERGGPRRRRQIGHGTTLMP